MKKMFPVLLTMSLVALLFPRAANAIIFLPALILIPIAKIVAVVVGGFTLPSLGVGVVSSKLFGSPLAKTISIIVFVLILLALAIAFYLHLQNPDRPLI